MKKLILSLLILSTPAVSHADIEAVSLRDLIVMSDVIMIGRVTSVNENKVGQGGASLYQMGTMNGQPSCLKGKCPANITVAWGSEVHDSRIRGLGGYILFLKYSDNGLKQAAYGVSYFPVQLYHLFNPKTDEHFYDTVIPMAPLYNIVEDDFLKSVMDQFQLKSNLDEIGQESNVRGVSINALIKKMERLP